MKCPCCKQTLPEAGIFLSLDANTIAVGWQDGEVRLPAQQAELAKVLIDAWPRTVSVDDITRGLWGSNEPPSENLANHISVLVCRLRAAIKPLGLVIPNVYRGRVPKPDSADPQGGYRIAKKDPRP